MTVQITASSAITTASGLLLVVLGLVILRVRPLRRANVALAVFSGTFGLSFVLANLALSILTPDEPLQPAAATATAVSRVPAAIALVALALSLPRASAAGEGRPIAIGAAAALAVAAAVALLTRDELLGRAEDIAFAGLVGALWFALFLFAARFGRARGDAGAGLRRQYALLTVALLTYAGVWWPARPTSGLPRPTALLFFLLAVHAVLAAVWLRNSALGGPSGRPARSVALWALAIPAAAAASRLLGDVAWAPAVGVGRIAMVLVLAYGILNHQLLGVDVRVKWTLKQSTLAAIFVAVFFAASEGAQAIFSDTLGTTFGIAAAAALVFAIHPLQGFAQRVADKAMPGVKVTSEMSPSERATVYRGLAQVAWADGSLSGDERMMLEEARARLGLDPAEAAAIERDALAIRRGVA